MIPEAELHWQMQYAPLMDNMLLTSVFVAVIQAHGSHYGRVLERI